MIKHHLRHRSITTHVEGGERDRELRLAGALETAQAIAAHSPVAVQGTKVNLNFSRGRTVSDGLEFQSAWNAAMLQTQDMGESMTAAMTGKPARFSKL